MFTAEIKNGKLILTLNLEAPAASKSGKTFVVASTRGNKATSVLVDGKPLTIGVNAYISAN